MKEDESHKVDDPLSLSLYVFEMWPVMFLFNVIHFAHTHTYIHVQYVFRVHVCVIIYFVCSFILLFGISRWLKKKFFSLDRGNSV